MKIYRVVPDVNRYQGLSVQNGDIWKSNLLTFDCTPKAGEWVPPRVYVLHPKLKRGSFYGLCPGTVVCDPRATADLRDLLEMCGELLPLLAGNETLTVLNVIECVNALDAANTKWVYGKSTGAKIRIERYSFCPERLTEAPLFKIPETAKADVLTAEGMKDPEDEFKHRVEANGLEGLIFEEIWNG